MFAPWPKPLGEEERLFFGLDDASDQVAQAKYDLVSLGRNLRRELKLDPAKKLKFVLRPPVIGESPSTSAHHTSNAATSSEVEVLKILLNAEAIEVNPAYSPPKGTPMAANAFGELFLPLAGLIDVAAEQARLTKELEKIKTEIEKVEQKLANPNFAQKVPPAVLEEHKQRLAQWQAKQQQVQGMLANLS